jgi:glutathione S-transferase
VGGRSGRAARGRPARRHLLEEQPALVAYKQRCEARPAFIKALADQMASFG